MVTYEKLPLGPRLAAQGALTLAITAGSLFILIVVLGTGGSTELADIFGPIAVVATVLGIVTGILATINPRTRTVGITALFILVPCLFLSALTLVALLSR